MNALPLSIDPHDGALYSVPCVVLGLGLVDGASAPSRTSAEFMDNHVKAWQRSPGQEVRRAVNIEETGRSWLRVADLQQLQADRRLANGQDGGNGSGGDASANTFNADMIDSRLGFTFWKRDRGEAQSPLGTLASPESRAIFEAKFDPGFARFFPSHHQAFQFLGVNGAGAFLHATFTHILVVAVRADSTDFVLNGADNGISI